MPYKLSPLSRKTSSVAPAARENPFAAVTVEPPRTRASVACVFFTTRRDPAMLSADPGSRRTAVVETVMRDADPPPSPTPAPPSGGGSTPDPSGFTGPTLGDPAVWKQQASFEEDFPTLAPRGQFLSIYKMWSAYPTNYVSTDKQGIYEPYNIEMVEFDGLKVMQIRVVSGRTNGRGKPSGA
jgi:hypothetical protein